MLVKKVDHFKDIKPKNYDSFETFFSFLQKFKRGLILKKLFYPWELDTLKKQYWKEEDL